MGFVEAMAAVLDLMRRKTGAEPRVIGTALVGFGEYHYEDAGGTFGKRAAEG